MKEEFQLRLKKILAHLEENALEGLLIYGYPWESEHIRYITNYRLLGTRAYALLSKNGELSLFISVLTDLERAERDSWASKVIPLTYSLEELPAEMKRMEISKKLGVAGFETIPARILRRISDDFPKIEFVSSSRALTNIRAIKSEYEIKMIRRAAQIADIGFETFLQNIKTGIKQYELIAEVERRVRHEGAEDNFMLFSSGGVEVRGMTPARNKELKSGDMILTEVTPSYNGYFTQICRGVVLGEISKERQRSFDLFFRATEEGLKIAKPGVPVSEIARAENKVFEDEGFGEYATYKWTRSRGHGQGLHLAESPHIWEDSKEVLQEGMLIIVHPNTYLPLAGYMVFGDPTLITAKGPEILTKTERKLFSVQP